MHVLHSNKTLDTLLTGTGMTSASACPIVYISERICLFTLETVAERLWCWFGSQNTIFFHCHESVTLIHAVFETLIAIHIFQRFFGIIPQSNGADDHPTPNQFLYVYRLLSVSNLVKHGKRMNVESKPGDILLTIQKLQQQPTPFVPQIEILIDEILIQDSCSSYDQSDVAEHAYNVSSPEQCITFYLGGYVAHHITTVAVQSTYALRVLRAHGLCGPRLWEVARATAVAKLTYACSAWWGFADSGARSRIQAVMSKLERLGFSSGNVCFVQICEDQDNNLLSQILSNEHHVLHQLLRPVKNIPYSLRPRPHDRELPVAGTTMRKNFIVRMLYSKL